MRAPTFSGQEALATLRAGWRRVLVVACVATAIVVAYVFLVPKWYTAYLAVVPSTAPKGGGALPLLGGGSSLMSSSPMDLASDLGLGGSDVERIGAVLRSTSVTDAVITKFDLVKRYDVRYLEEARTELWEHCSVRVDKKPGVVVLSCEDRSPQVAREMTAFFGEFGNRVFRRVTGSSATEERRFLEQRVAEARRDLEEASRRLREFQETHKVVDLPEQSKAVVASMAALRGELLAKQVELGYHDGFSSRDESTGAQLRRQIGVLQGKLHSLEEAPAPASQAATGKAPRNRGAAKDNGTGIFPAALAVPKLRHEAERLFRELKVQETLFVMLAQRYESARVSEARDTSTFQILDQPTLPTMKSRPKRAMITAMGLLLGLCLGAAWVLVPPFWRSLPASTRRNTDRGGGATPTSTGERGAARD
ncbi:MAG: hypothetical protein HY906_26055 [Deltaproteobacteria bacterium]|nr:hypothetical protein [Deltaproteobacteria bacterium]